MANVAPQREGERAVNFYVEVDARERFNAWLGAIGLNLADVGRDLVEGLPRLDPLVWARLRGEALRQGRTTGALLAQAIETGLATMESATPAPTPLSSLPPAPRGLPVVTSEGLVEVMTSLRDGQTEIREELHEIRDRLDRAGIDGKNKPVPPAKKAAKR